MKNYLLLCLLFISQLASASHNKGGYISFQHISGNTYEIKVTFYTDANAVANLRREIPIDWGHNSKDSLVLDSEITVASNPSLLKRVFMERHTFPGAGNYTIVVEDPNRVEGISNISNSVLVPVYVETQLRILPLAGTENNSAQVSSPLAVKVETSRTFKYNIAAFDDDLDVLFYELVPTKGKDGQTAAGYESPMGLNLDVVNGELSWEPSQAGLYAVTVKISECRNNVILSSTLVDLLIEVAPNPGTSSLVFSGTTNWTKDLEGRFVSNISAGDSLSLDLTLTDVLAQNSMPEVQLLRGNENASLSSISNTAITTNKRFEWVPDSNDRSCTPHLFTFRGTNNKGLTEDLSLLVYVKDSTLTDCDSLCGRNAISLPEYVLNKAVLDLQIGPNPFSTQTTIKILSEQRFDKAQLKLYNSNGKLVRLVDQNATNEFNVQRNELNCGIYFFSLEGSNRRYGSGKLILLDN